MRCYWLMKSEPDEVSIDDLAAMPRRTIAWYGVRNYQARNFMRDQMQVGDLAFFYHSSCPAPGIAVRTWRAPRSSISSTTGGAAAATSSTTT